MQHDATNGPATDGSRITADESHVSIDDSGSPGYPADTPGYPNEKSEDHDWLDEDDDYEEPPAPRADDLDLDRFLEPREAAKLFTSDQPVAHDGKAGWVVERKTGRAIWMDGERQWEVMNRLPGAPRDEPGLTDFPAHGGLPKPGATEEELRDEADRAQRKRSQIGLKLSITQAEELEAAAESSASAPPRSRGSWW